MPEITRFYGIIIYINLKDKEHNPPHIHAKYGGRIAAFKISDGELLFGSFPVNGQRLVKEFVLRNKEALLEMWETGIYKKLAPLK